MSYRLLQAVVDMENIPPVEKAVLTVLARYADDNGANAFPSIETIALKSGFSERSVRNGLAGLKKLGLIKAVGNGKGGRVKGGCGKVTRWLLIISETRQDVPPCESTRHVVPEYPARGAADSINEEIKEEREVACAREPTLDEMFAEFWAAYPRKVGKDAAKAKFAKALQRATHAEIMGGLARYRAQREGQDEQYTAHPSTWLHQGRWADEITPSKDRSHDQPRRPASGKPGRRNVICEPAAYRGGSVLAFADEFGVDGRGDASGFVPRAAAGGD